MKRKIDSVKGRLIYNQRLGAAEPAFAHVRHALGLNRFTLRGKRKVDIQWKVYCIVHNLIKIQRYGEDWCERADGWVFRHVVYCGDETIHQGALNFCEKNDHFLFSRE